VAQENMISLLMLCHQQEARDQHQP